MANKEVKKYRFNYVMTETERKSLQLLREHEVERGNRGATVGSIIRNLVSEEVKRVLNTP